MHQNWLVSRTNSEFLNYLASKASISHILAQVLVNRGIKDVDSIKKFLSPSLEDLHDPFLLTDMDKAVERLSVALEKKETVLVHGDYDADGVTSTALMVSVLRTLGLKTYYHIPNRMTEGYGFSMKGIEKAKACKASLIITADCGISSHEEVAAAMAIGIDVIVTDHHQPSEELPLALAVIDPHRKDSLYPFKYLAGVGVVFKLVQALALHSKFKIQDSIINNLLDLVAIGTVADSVPLIGENRVLVNYGLKIINSSPCRVGIEALKEIARLKDDLRSINLAFALIPRINAVGRLDDATDVVELLLAEERSDAERLASFLDEQNRTRQKIQGDVLKSASEMIDPEDLGSAIVLASSEWHPGVVGIVASRLVEMYNRPVFMFSIKDSVAKGSARSIAGFHLYKAISECSEHIITFGGHSQAAGLSLQIEKLNLFREQINKEVSKSISKDEMVPVLKIDAAVKFSDINFALIKELDLLEPYGESNREPMLGAKETEIINHRIVGTNHLKMQLKQDRVNVDSIGFSMGDAIENIGDISSMDIAFVPSINEWNGNTTLQLTLKAIKPAG